MQTTLKLEWLGSAAGEGLGTAGDHEQTVNQQCHVAAKNPNNSHLGMEQIRFVTHVNPRRQSLFPTRSQKGFSWSKEYPVSNKYVFKSCRKPRRELDRFKQTLVRGSQGTQRWPQWRKWKLLSGGPLHVVLSAFFHLDFDLSPASSPRAHPTARQVPLPTSISSFHPTLHQKAKSLTVGEEMVD